jgi:hypothetical protein
VLIRHDVILVLGVGRLVLGRDVDCVRRQGAAAARERVCGVGEVGRVRRSRGQRAGEVLENVGVVRGVEVEMRP